MINYRGAVYDFHTAVAVHIRSGKTVVALSGKSGIYRIRPFHLMYPFRSKRIIHRHMPAVNPEFLPETIIKEIISGHRRSGIVASCHDQIGTFPVQISHTGKETIHPVAGLYTRQGIIPPEKPVILTAHRETHCLQLPSVAGEHGQIFRPFINKAFEFIQFIFFTPRRRIYMDEIIGKIQGILFLQRIGTAPRGSNPLHFPAFLQCFRPLSRFHLRTILPMHKYLRHMPPVVFGRTDIVILMPHSRRNILGQERDIPFLFCRSVRPVPDHFGSGRCFYRHFRFPVTVEIIDHKLGIMGSRPDIHPHIQTPQKSAVQLHTVQIAFSRISLNGNIVGIGRIPFYDVFIFAVSVHIPDAHIVGMIFISLPCGRHASLRFMKGDIQVLLFPDLHLAARLPFPAVLYGSHCVPVFFRSPGIQIIRALHHRPDPFSVPVYHEIRPGHACVGISAHFLQKQPPAQENSVSRLHGHKPSVQPFQLFPEHLFHRRPQGITALRFFSVPHRRHPEIMGDMRGLFQGITAGFRLRHEAVPYGTARTVRPIYAVTVSFLYRLPGNTDAAVRHLFPCYTHPALLSKEAAKAIRTFAASYLHS